MMNSFLLNAFLLFACATAASLAAQAPDSGIQNATSTSVTQKLFTYTGPLLPSDWTLVSILNERAVIGFKNGSARNALMEELDSKDRGFLQRLQNGTVYSTPLSSAKEKFAQWTSSVTSTVSEYSKKLRDQFINKKNSTSPANETIASL